MMRIILSISFLAITSSAHAITCDQIIQKSHPKKGKASCVMTSQSLGLGRASTETIYTCGKINYKLIADENFDCKVSKTK